MVVLDVGAYVGELTLLFSKFVSPGGRVHAFEATEASFSRLQKHMQGFGRTNVVLNHQAVFDIEGTVDIHVYDDDSLSWNSLANRPLERYGIDVRPTRKEAVASVTVDRYCEVQGIEFVDLLKIDVEGAEYEVLRGASRMLESRRIACCAFEFGQTTFDMGHRPEDIRQLLSENGYRIRNIVSRDPPFPGGRRAGTAMFSMHVATPNR